MKTVIQRVTSASVTVVRTDHGDNRKLVRKNDFVINSRSDRKGSSGISDYDGSVSVINIALKPITNNNLKYIHYLLRSVPFTEEFYRNGKGLVADLWTTKYSEMRNIFIPIPPRTEQDQIVRYLDWKTSEIVRFVKEKKKEINLLAELKNAIISHAILHGLNSNVEEKDCSISWVHTIPKHWDEVSLFQCASEQSVSNKNVHHQNLLSLSYGKIVNKDINTSTGLLPASFDTYQLIYDGNVILRLTDLQNDHKSLRVGLATQTGIITSAYTCLKPRDCVIPEYLYLLLHSYDVSKVFYGMGGGVRQSIGYSDIRHMTLILPPKGEQQEIVDYCYSEQTKIEQMIDGIKSEIALVEELRTKIISDAVIGKVDVRGVEVPDFVMETEDADEDEDTDADNEDEEKEDDE